MMRMYKRWMMGVAVVALGLGAAAGAVAEEGVWFDDWDAALAAAETGEGDRDVLVWFTGSDWCAWCIKLDEDVFSQAAFIEGVSGGYVLMEVDLPTDTDVLTEETLAQNEALAERYGPNGFPSVFVMDAQARPYAVIGGYVEGGPERYLEVLAGHRETREARDAAFAEADGLEGAARALKLREGLGHVEADLHGHYPAEREEIAALEAAAGEGDGPEVSARELAERYMQDRRTAARYAGAAADRRAFYTHRLAMTEEERAVTLEDVVFKEYAEALVLVGFGRRDGLPPDELIETEGFVIGVGRLLGYRYRDGAWPVGSQGNAALMAVYARAEYTRDVELARRCVDEWPGVRANLADLGFMGLVEARFAQLEAGEIPEGEEAEGFYGYLFRSLRENRPER